MSRGEPLPGYVVAFTAGHRVCVIFVRAPRPDVADIETRARRALVGATRLPAAWFTLAAVHTEDRKCLFRLPKHADWAGDAE